VSYRLRPSLRGQTLNDHVQKAAEARPPLIEGLISEGATVMTYAAPGIGKSTIILCAVAQASSGSLVFGQLPCVRPLKTYYLVAERTVQEPLERLRLMQKRITINWNNLILDDGYSGIANVTREEFANELLGVIKTAFDGSPPDIVVMDPIYCFVPGGFSKEDRTQDFIRFSGRLSSQLGCSVWWNHHATKDIYAEGAKVEREDPYYGPVWLKAAATCTFQALPSEDGITLHAKKDNYRTAFKTLPLIYDSMTCVSELNTEYGSLYAKDRALIFLNSCAGTGHEFTFDDFCTTVKVSDSRGRDLFSDTSIKPRLVEVKRLNKKLLYRAKPL